MKFTIHIDAIFSLHGIEILEAAFPKICIDAGIESYEINWEAEP